MQSVLVATQRSRKARRVPHRPEARRPSAKAIEAANTVVARLVDVPCPPGLTRREAQLLPWLATDLSYAAIALQLGYGPHNARLLALRLLRKLGVNSRPAAVTRWLRPDAFDATLANQPA